MLVLTRRGDATAVELLRRPDGPRPCRRRRGRAHRRRPTPRSPTSRRRSGRRAASGAPSSSTCPSTCRPADVPAGRRGASRRPRRWSSPPPDPDGVARLAAALGAARRPVFIAGRGARGAGCRPALEALAAASGALAGHRCRGERAVQRQPVERRASPAASRRRSHAELISGADLLVGWGCALNMWTMSHGALIGPGATVAQVDLEPEALGRHRPIDVGVVGDVRATAEAVTAALPRRRRRRVPHAGRRRAHRGAHPLERRADRGPARRPTASTRASSARCSTRSCPGERVVATDSGNFQGYPERLPVGARRVRLLHDPGVPVDRPRPGDGDRRRPRPAAPAARRRARRRRRADGRQRARDRRPPRAADGRRRVRRRGLRRRGPPLRRRTTSARASSPTPTSRRSAAATGSRA